MNNNIEEMEIKKESPIILKIRDFVAEKYHKIHKNFTDEQIAKSLTRDFILGIQDTKKSNERYLVRRYGNSKMVLDTITMTVIGFYVNESDNRSYINYSERKSLNKLYGL